MVGKSIIKDGHTWNNIYGDNDMKFDICMRGSDN